MKKTTILVYILILIAVNIFVIYPYFFQDFPRWISSIETGFITMGRWFAQNFLRSWWIPQWYAGIPFHLVYAPLIPGLTALVGSLVGNFGQGYHLVAGVVYALVPVSLFLFIRKLTKSDLAAFSASLFFSVAPTFGLFFPHVHDAIFEDMALWRLIILVYYGEAPHTASMIFFPLSALFAFKALEENKLTYVVISSLFLALTALANPIGLFGGLVLLFIVFFSWGLWKKEWRKVLVTGLKIFGLGYLLSAFWYNPSFILNDLVGEGGQVGSELFLHFPWRFLFFLGLILGIIFLLKKLITTVRWGIGMLWFLAMFVLLGGFYFFNITLVPQVRRFIVELDMAGATLIGLLISGLSSTLSKKFKKLSKTVLTIVFSSVVIFASIAGLLSCWKTIDWFIKLGPSPVTVQEFREYKLAEWLKQNTNPTDRIFVSANYTFWLNLLTDIWQLRGCHFQASIHPWEPHAGYQITAGEDGKTSLMWAKIFNFKYMVVNPLDSHIHYQDYFYPEKFRGLLPQIGKIHEDIIYEVTALPGLARSVSLSQAQNLPEPSNGADSASLEKYMEWLEEGNKLNFSKIKDDIYKIDGQLSKGEGVRVGMTYAKGWRAKDELGNTVPVSKDSLGFILLKPQEAGPISIVLSYFPPISVWLGVLASAATITFLMFYGLASVFRKK